MTPEAKKAFRALIDVQDTATWIGETATLIGREEYPNAQLLLIASLEAGIARLKNEVAAYAPQAHHIDR